VSKSYCTNSFGDAPEDQQVDAAIKPGSPSPDPASSTETAASKINGGCQTDFSSRATPYPGAAMALLLWLLLRRRLHTPG